MAGWGGRGREGEAGIANPDTPRGQTGSEVSWKLQLATPMEPQAAEQDGGPGVAHLVFKEILELQII